MKTCFRFSDYIQQGNTGNMCIFTATYFGYYFSFHGKKKNITNSDTVYEYLSLNLTKY